MIIGTIIKYIFRIIFFSLFIVILCVAGILIYLFTGEAEPVSEISYGVTFSQIFAEQMELDWPMAYSAILDDLGARKLRLVAYWQKLEPVEGEYAFADLDWQIEEAGKRGAQVILAVGQKLPRWPECHYPEWAENLSEAEKQEKILLLLTQIVNRYQNNNTVKVWQVENEPFLVGFGECPKLDRQFLDKEISLVQKLDSKGRPVLLTASGELSSWIEPAVRADLLGTTLYRIVWSDIINDHFKYPIPPVFYHKRAQIAKWVTGIEKVIIIELQAEPWSHKMLYETDKKEQSKSMDLEQFKEVIKYTEQTGFDEAYLWGVEWWYWKKEQGNNSIWAEAKTLFN
ncbi:MAG: hypothetical protein CMI55_02060 [Parcubacteria group bacterium]|jgi:hypothetical protein|nr:hypothetical protein [Parcubacteria group bacterium]|tara:strand:+ start:4597 stop:5622 length:1026 start_codon:yes stop_codon:yes gene_type:complete